MTNTNIFTNLPDQKKGNMKNKIITIVICIIVSIFIALLIVTNVTAQWLDTDSKQIADLEYQMNELRKAKEQCYNNLTYDESIQVYNWFTQPCVERDEQIMELREIADNLKSKTYEKGFIKNR